MDLLLQDLRYATRRLSRAPGFALVAILTLALGIGANTAIFSFVNALLLKPAAGVTQPHQLVRIFTADFSSSQYASSSYPDYEDFRRQRDVFRDVAAMATSAIALARADHVERVNAEMVTPNYLSLMGVSPVAGRMFTEADASGAGAEPVIVLSESLWRSRYDANPAVIGGTIQVNSRPFTVIGVAKAPFHGLTTGTRTDAWLPMPAALFIAGDGMMGSRDSRGLSVYARLADGVQVSAAQAKLEVLRQQLYQAYPDAWRNIAGKSRALTVMGERAARVPPDARGSIFTLGGLLLGSVALVLLICCANVANLLLARAAVREREVAIRYSLGARRGAVVRQLLVESGLLALLGGGAGLLIALWTTDLLIGWQPSSGLPLFFDVSIDPRVLGFTLLISATTGLLFGLAPALQSTRVNLAGMLKSERTLSASGRARLRDVLVAGQIAIALVLAVGAGLLARTLRNASQVDVGLNIENTVVARVDLFTAGYSVERARDFYREVDTRLKQRPEVAAVTFANRIPLADAAGRRGVRVVGYTPQPGEEMEFPFNVVSANYFETMSLPIVVGRSFDQTDRSDSRGVVIVNETFAQRFWPNQDPIGKQITQGGDQPPLEVVGVARNGKYWSIEEAPRPYYYLPFEQTYARMTVHVKARGSDASAQTALRDVIRGIDPLLSILVLDSMAGLMAQSLLSQRIAGTLVGFFAALAILLAAIGVYGVTSVLVAQRVPEIGLRVALGAGTADVMRLIVGRAMLVAGAGITAGFVLAALATRGLESMLFGVSRFDPMTFVVSALVLGAAAALAGYLPARRATRVDPLIALKS